MLNGLLIRHRRRGVGLSSTRFRQSGHCTSCGRSRITNGHLPVVRTAHRQAPETAFRLSEEASANERAGCSRPKAVVLSACNGLRIGGLPPSAECLECSDRCARGFRLRLHPLVGCAQQALIGLQDLDQVDDPFLVGRKLGGSRPA